MDKTSVKGLYSPEFEHDACGVGLIADLKGGKSHEIVEDAILILENMVHRGAESADNKTGDGAGIMTQIPHEFILLQGIPVPEKGKYGVGMIFTPKDEKQKCIDIIKEQSAALGLNVTAIRDVPVNSSILGETALKTEPAVIQAIITPATADENLERTLYILRKHIEHAAEECGTGIDKGFYICSLSTRNIIYKGMLSSLQLRAYYPDLSSPYFTSGMALVHSRFSTNTFPTWALAQPFRLLGHNGEINTIKGNRSWMQAREGMIDCDKMGDMSKIYPIIQKGMSDSASLDNALEYFVMTGMSLPNALAMLVPESWNDKNPISNELKAFYEYHSILMEPWDGPAALLFSDGRYAGGMLDRNGLRPARYITTKDGKVIIASEAGVLPVAPENIESKSRLRPGKMVMIDTETGKVMLDSELKETLAKQYPYTEWLAKNRIDVDNISSGRTVKHTIDDYEKRFAAFGYYKEDLEKILIPMAVDAKEPVSSMGNDTPLAVLSDKPQRLFAYFKQLFAQVTNPPIDSIREELVMSLRLYIGTEEGNMLVPSDKLCKMVKLQSPVIDDTQLDILKNIRYKGFKSLTLPMTFNAAQGSLTDAVSELCKSAEKAVDDGYNYIIISDRDVDETHAPIPSLLAVSAIHHHLISVRKRMQTAIVVESAEPRELTHFALLFAYGASAINPYMALAVINKLIENGDIKLDYGTAVHNYIKAVDKGLLKTMSKMGISTIRSYRGAKIFEPVGLSQKFLDLYMGGGDSVIGGIDIEDIERDCLSEHSKGYKSESSQRIVENLGQYAFRKDGEKHAWNPETIYKLQIATRRGDYALFKDYTNTVNSKPSPIFLRDMLNFKGAAQPVPIEEVEPVEEICKRFVTGAMSFGSISKEAHEAIAVAMNTLGGKSNTGEGGEDPERFKIGVDGLNRRSAIKQIASGRFGVTTEYLVNADELQIKIAQGAKPGEGGQLPGFKVNEIIAKTRHSIPGISLISPPPHHDIYSIEDLAQLIFDLKNVNPQARVSVKLVSEAGVGTIAAGVAKAKADVILISGGDGGTGASPAASIKHAGLPVELGLAETQQTLVLNNLRGSVRLQADGQLKTGRDIVIMSILGAEEFGFATSALIVLGCVMMRKCHTNTCPMGVATQNEELRKRFMGRSEYLINFFHFLAQEVREILASLGYRSLDEITGHTELLEFNAPSNNIKAGKVNLDQVLFTPEQAKENAVKMVRKQDHHISDVLDQTLIKMSERAIERNCPLEASFDIKNTNRSTGAMLSGFIAKRYGDAGLADGFLKFTFKGSAGQSFGAFLTHGTEFRLEGEANDYIGKSLSGGVISIVPPAGVTYAPEDNIIAGNTSLYGATSGEVYINGRVGERFCVRNSGATAVVEGTGDHCCEYMTGGRTVVLGTVGRNFAAGMSGGLAYVLDEAGNFDYFCNMEMVELSLIEDMADARELKQLIQKHLEHTGSPRAKHILDHWADYIDKFIKVTPIEYKKVLHAEKLKAMEQKIAKVERDY